MLRVVAQAALRDARALWHWALIARTYCIFMNTLAPLLTTACFRGAHEPAGLSFSASWNICAGVRVCMPMCASGNQTRRRRVLLSRCPQAWQVAIKSFILPCSARARGGGSKGTLNSAWETGLAPGIRCFSGAWGGARACFACFAACLAASSLNIVRK